MEMRPITAEELPAFVRQLGQTFQGRTPPAEFVEARRETFELDRSLGVFDGGQLVGTAGVYSLEMTVPGGFLPAAGVTMVTVSPTHRRQGILRALMRRQLDDIHAREEPLAALYASEAGIYGRFGYGLASYHSTVRIERSRSAFAAPFEDPGRLAFADAAAARAACPPVYERVRANQQGMVDMTEARWRVRFDDPEAYRDGWSELYTVLHTSGDAADGYALFRKRMDWAPDGPRGELRVVQLLAASPAAYAALWRFCLDFDLMARTEAEDRPVKEPLRHLLADPRAAQESLADGIWLRLVDVRAALAGRRYAVPGSLVLAVHDEFCPWNAGVLALEGGSEGSECGTAASAAADLELSAADLAAVYLGGETFLNLAIAGRVSELRPGALARADAMFHTSVPPWTPLHF